MNKAFIFDMDGVLIDSESLWGPVEAIALPRLLGKEISEKLGGSLGLSLHDFYDSAVRLGATVSREEFIGAYEQESKKVYREAPLSDGLLELGEYLVAHNWKLGLVSMSPLEWIEYTLEKIPFRDKFEVVISLSMHPLLRPKPAPDGYIKAMEVLGAEPHTSAVLEDSNTGLRAAKDSGAYTIGFRGHLPANYHQIGADAYAETMTDVRQLMEEFDKKLTRQLQTSPNS
jgi:beta-phosphoglucomutase-like phosphatase (HAD superfamily)